MTTSQSGVINFSHLTLTLVYRCNYRCPSCLVGEKLASHEHLSYDDAVRIIDSAAELDTIGVVAFVGGEPFLVHPLMVRIAQYIHENYRVPLTASTNSYWARTVDQARRKVEPLAKNGLRSLLLSWDDFHAQFGSIEQIANAVTASREFGIQPTIQNIYIKGSTRIGTIKETLDRLCDTSDVRWVENPCIPIGLGSELEPTLQPLENIDDMPYGRCTAGTVVNVQANGDVKPCCGAGLMVDALTMGNIRDDGMARIVQQASTDPLFNSLVAYKGPKHLVEVLRGMGRDDLVPAQVTDPCDACQKILDNAPARALLRQALQEQQIQLLLSRVASEEFSRVVHADMPVPSSPFALVPNIESAEYVAALHIDDWRPEFFRSSVSPHRRPIVLRSPRLRGNPAVANWRDPAYLIARAGDFPVEVTHGLVLDKHTKRTVRFRDYLELIANECYLPEFAAYMRFHDIPASLLGDVEDTLALFRQWTPDGSEQVSRPPLTKLFIGRYSYTDSHEHAGYDAFMYQIAGRKEVLLHEPSTNNLEALYAGKFKNWSPVRFLKPDFERYPLFRDNQPVRAVVQAGEALYIPDGWFHAVASLGDDVAMTLTYFFQPAATKPCAAPDQVAAAEPAGAEPAGAMS